MFDMFDLQHCVLFQLYSKVNQFIYKLISPLFLHTVHGVLEARTLKWFAIPFSSGPRFVRTLHHDSSIFGDPERYDS